MLQVPPKRTVHGTRSSVMRGAMLLLAACLTRLEQATANVDAFCADRANALLPMIAEDLPDIATAAGCNSAAPGVVCGLIGAFSLCEDLPICAGVEVSATGCTALTAAQSCCNAVLSPPCENCEPEVLTCRQECLDIPPPDTGPPAAPDTPPVQDAALACSNRAESILKSLADMNPAGFAVGCDDADPRVNCGIRSSVGSCEANPVCPADQIDQGSCTSATGPPSCCDVVVTRPCDGCDPIPVQCLNVCASNSPNPEISAAERNNRLCIDDADIFTATFRADGTFPPSCASAQPGQTCEFEGAGGACGAGSLCSGADVRLGSSCSDPGSKAENGCCIALVAPPCSGCNPEPVNCLQTCV